VNADVEEDGKDAAEDEEAGVVPVPALLPVFVEYGEEESVYSPNWVVSAESLGLLLLLLLLFASSFEGEAEDEAGGNW
jgi:hypothetical protein